MPRTAATARTVAPARRLVTPQGGWWTGVGSMSFDGVDDRVDGTTRPVIGANPITMCCWVMPKTTGAAGIDEWMSIGKDDANKGFGMGATSSKFKTTNYAVANVLGPLCTAGRWWHVAATYGGAGTPLRLYVDSVLVGTSANYNIAIDDYQMRIGCIVSGTGGAAPSYQFDARVYGAVLSSANLATIMRGEIFTTNLLRHWPLESIVGGKTRELILGTDDTVTGAVIDSTRKPWAARTAAGARIVAP